MPALLETDRLSIRRMTPADAAFILEVLNEPSFIQNIGDRGVRTVPEAERYLEAGPLASYETHGFGLYLVELREHQEPIGICGLLKRQELEDVDLGFSLLPKYWAQGYALEAARAVLDYARDVLHLKRVVAITALHNEASARLLGKLGFTFERIISFEVTGEPLKLFAAG
jgi:RimJ/RimL family protein N-acetyltransferase